MMRQTKIQESLKEKFYRYCRYLKLSIVRISDTPEQIARGVAAGVFAAHLPLLPMQMILAVILAFIVKGNKVAAVAATTITNPLTAVPAHMLYYFLGKAVVPFKTPPFDPTAIDWNSSLEIGWRLYATLGVGALIIGLPLSIISYFLARKSVAAYRSRKERRKQNRED